MNPIRWTAPPGTTGLIFDCDGTLADTMPAHYKAWTAMLGRYGIPFPDTRFYAMGGMPTASIIRVLAADAGVSVDDVDAMVREKEQAFLAHLDAVSVIEPILRVAAMYRESYRSRLPAAAIATRSAHSDRLGIRDWFDAMVVAEDTPRHKPEPDVFLEGAPARVAARVAWSSKTPTSVSKPPAAQEWWGGCAKLDQVTGFTGSLVIGSSSGSDFAT